MILFQSFFFFVRAFGALINIFIKRQWTGVSLDLSSSGRRVCENPEVMPLSILHHTTYILNFRFEFLVGYLCPAIDYSRNHQNCRPRLLDLQLFGLFSTLKRIARAFVACTYTVTVLTFEPRLIRIDFRIRVVRITEGTSYLLMVNCYVRSSILRSKINLLMAIIIKQGDHRQGKSCN